MEEMLKKVKRARAGDKAALLELVQNRKERLYRIAWAYLQDEYEVKDALQETIVKAFHDIADLRKPEYFYTWYTRVLINTCKSFLLHRRKVVSLEVMGEETAQREEMPDGRLDVEQGLLRLSEEHREVIVMHYLEDLPVKEVARILGIPEGTVKSRIYYGILSLRQWVGEREVQEL